MMQTLYRKLVGNFFGSLGGLIVFTILFLAIVGPFVSPHNPEALSVAKRLSPPAWDQRGSRQHLLGTDMLGRDVLSRLLYGVRNSILVGLGSSLIALSIGVSLGIISGYFGGMINIAVMRLVNIMLAIPPVMLAVALVAVIGPHAISVILAMGLTMWSEYASVVRSRVLVMKEESFVLATRTLGAGDLRIILRHILPNIAYLIIVIFTLQVGQIILWASGLSFIGIGGADVSWGWDIAAGRVYIGKAWWLTTFPGMAIFVTVLGFNLFGDWLRDAVDPTFQMKA